MRTILALLLACAPPALGLELQAVVAGRYAGALSAYKVGPDTYLNAREAGKLYGAQVYWYPVAGRVQMSFRGKAVQFLANSARAQAGDRTFPLAAPVLLRSGTALLPMDLFLSEDFAEWSGMDAEFNERTRLLTLERRHTVGPLRWYSYEGQTRLVIELKPGAAYSAAARGVGGLEAAFPMGIIESGESADIGDGVVAGYSLRQEANGAKLSLRFSRAGCGFRARELPKTAGEARRLVIDVYAPGRRVPSAVAPDDLGAAVKPRAPGRAPAGKAPAETAAVSVATRAVAVGTTLPQVATPAGRPKRRIVVDAGHGGKDPGALGSRGTAEKDFNLAVALDLARLLRQEDAFEVLMTRSDDSFIPLSDRSRLANEFDSDLFVSLHCNAERDRRESGYEIYFLSERASDPEAARLAEFENSVLKYEDKGGKDDAAAEILIAMAKTEHINEASELAGLMSKALSRRVDLAARGVKQADFYVLRGTNAPAVLVEMAFVSNSGDEAKLESPRYRRRIVDGIYAGLLDYSKRQGWLAEAP